MLFLTGHLSVFVDDSEQVHNLVQIELLLTSAQSTQNSLHLSTGHSVSTQSRCSAFMHVDQPNVDQRAWVWCCLFMPVWTSLWRNFTKPVVKFTWMTFNMLPEQTNWIEPLIPPIFGLAGWRVVLEEWENGRGECTSGRFQQPCEGPGHQPPGHSE
jgi:hypothetical protein